jgi:MoxR-like ATPase
LAAAVFVEYPNFDDEFEIAKRTTTRSNATVKPVLNAADIVKLQDIIRDVPVSDHVIRYALSLVRQTRIGSEGIPEYVSEHVAWGAGPRAVQFLILGGKTRALMHGRTHVSIEDIQSLAKPVLRHRLAINFAAQSDGVNSDNVVEKLIESTPTHENELINDARFQKIFAS